MILQQQYALTQRSRETLLAFIETEITDHLNTPMSPYGDKSIRHLLEHNAGCYFFWIAYFALQLPATSLQLFPHVVTHEFHHKGQILVMCRQLGHIPPDTDISISF